MRATGAVVALLILVGTARAEDAPRVYAIVLGVNAPPREPFRPLRFADDDAARYSEVLSAYADETILLTTLDADTQRQHRGLAGRARAPTASELTTVVTHLRQRVRIDRAAGRRTELILAYAGHGFVDDAGAVRIALEGGGLSAEDLANRVISGIGADRTHLLLDACHAGELVGARGDWADDTAPVDHAALVRAWIANGIESMNGVGYIVAGSADQETHEWSELRAGVFSHELLSGLLGAADVNRDGRIEYSEIGAFVAAANVGVDDPRARLEIRVRAPPADRGAPILDLARVRSARVLWLGAAERGRFHLEDARGLRYADFHKEGGSEMAVALLQAPFYYLRTETQEARIDGGSPRVVRGDALAWSRTEIGSRGAVAESFRRGLFATPYGPSFYRGHAAAAGDMPVEPAASARWASPGSRRDEAAPPRPRSTPPTREPVQRSGALQTLGWAGLGAAGVLAVGAGVAGWLTLDAQASFESRAREDGVRDEGLESRVRDRGLATSVLGGAALGAAVLGTSLILLSPDASTPQEHVSFRLGRDRLVLSLHGSL